MHPAFSVIFFTVASGAGYGLFILLVLLDIANLGPVMESRERTIYLMVALALITAGLISSTFHLANVKNAWRAMMRFRTSWLSREGILAVVFYPFALLYLAGIYLELEVSAFVVSTAGVLAALLALATVFSTGMIYTCLKTIRQWHTALTPLNYILLGLFLGSLLLSSIHTLHGEASAFLHALSLSLLAVAALAKAIFYFWIDHVTGPTLNTATGFTRAPVRLFDPGHSAATFLTQEFGYMLDVTRLTQLKILVFILGFMLPALLLVVSIQVNGILIWVAIFSAFTGIVLERWLFFAEARHAVMLYHGLQHT